MKYFNLRKSDRILIKFKVWKGIMSQSSYFKSRLDPVTLEGIERGDLKSWKTLRVEGSGWNLVGKLSTNPRYVIDITGTDLLSWGSWGGGVNSEKLEKWGIFNLRRSAQILLKFDVWKDSFLRALILNPNRMWWRGGWGGRNLKYWKMLRVEGSRWNLVGKISTSPRYGIDITGTDLLSLGEFGGRVNSKKLEKMRYF